jgi:hypothetical protein
LFFPTCLGTENLILYGIIRNEVIPKNTDLTNYGKKKSIINIQDLGLSIASQHFVGGQPILQVIFRKSAGS